MKKLKLGIFGFGCVGQGLYSVLNESDNFSAEIQRICIKDPSKDRPIDQGQMTKLRSEWYRT